MLLSSEAMNESVRHLLYLVDKLSPSITLFCRSMVTYGCGLRSTSDVKLARDFGFTLGNRYAFNVFPLIFRCSILTARGVKHYSSFSTKLKSLT